jgi:carboxypeptidase Q
MPSPKLLIALAVALTACSGEGSTFLATEAPRPSAPPPEPAPTPAPPPAPPPAPTPPPEEGAVKALREAVLSSSRAFDLVRSLSGEAGPRLSGSPGNKVAVAWAERTLAAEGLTKVHAEKVKVPHWERGEERGEILAPVAQPLALAALGGSVGTKPGGLVAEVIEVDSLEAVAKLDPAAVKGKIVFFYVKTERQRDGSGYGKAVRVRVLGPVSAAKLGAAGVVIRSIGTEESRMPHTGVLRYDDKVPKIPAAALATSDADLLHRVIAEGKPVRLRMALGAKSLPDADGASVIGDVEGSAAPDEIVLLGAHIESWDLGRGAIDDGAGCAIVIEAARQIAKLPRRPRRTVRVVLFANEENGSRGADGYAAAHAAELGRHVLAIEADLGAGRAYGTRFLGPPTASAAYGAVVAALAPLGVTAQEGDAFGGADLAPLRTAGVPVMDVEQDATTYFDVHHTANDTLERISKDDIDQAAAAYAVAAFEAADSAADFGRVPEEKRKRR